MGCWPMQQITTDRVFFRLYAEHRDWAPEIRQYTMPKEAIVNPQNFITPYRYANYEQAERAMIFYIRARLGTIGDHK
jgi:hypothetical protein